ncbi:MAG: ABC transporter substrate-binding protein [Jatrophihabitans sp.]
MRRATPQRRFRKLLAVGLSTGLVAMTAVVGWVGTAAPASAATESTLTLSNDQIDTFNPFISYADAALVVIGSIYPSLDIVAPDGTAKPYLADSWTTSDDKLTWTFKIHQGLKWSDGQPITAKDAAWTFNTIMTNKVAATANGSLVSNFAKVDAPDDTTLTITTKKPQANMLYESVPFTGMQILPEHIWAAKVAGNLRDYKNTDFPVVGYGPWTLTDYKTDQFTTLEANKTFFQGRPKFDKLVLQYFKNQDAAVQAVQSGEIDEASGVTATQYQAEKNKPGITAYQQAATRWTGIEINPGAKDKEGKPLKTNTANPILADAQVRRAIAYGIDRETLVKKILLGLGSPGGAYVPPAYKQWAWSPSDDQKVSYDKDKANQILDAAGYPKGADGIRKDSKTGKALSFRLGTHSDDTYDSQIANYLAGWMKDIGIKLTVQPQSYNVLNANLAKGDWDILMDGWGSGLDPSYLLSIQTCGVLPAADGSGGNTDAFFCDPKYDALYAQQQTQFDQTQRAQTIGQMQDILYQANCDIMLYNNNILALVRTDKVKNLVSGKPDSTGTMPLQGTWYNWLNAAPAGKSGSGSSSSGGMGAGAIVGIVVAVIVVAAVAGFVVLRRRSTAAERE